MCITAQVCTGVGFIGAGVIAKGSFRDPVRGVTTACAVWVSAALGVVAASGMWLFALYSTGLTVCARIVRESFALGTPRMERHDLPTDSRLASSTPPALRR